MTLFRLWADDDVRKLKIDFIILVQNRLTIWFKRFLFRSNMAEGEVLNGKSKSPDLHNAVSNSNFSSVCELIENIDDVNIRDANNDTPLHIAAKVENIDILNLLLSKGASVNIENDQGETPMHKAVMGTTSEVVESLLENGGSVNVYNNEGLTPFHVAVSKGYKKIIEPMLDWGADVHSVANNEQTPLHIAVYHWNCILAEMLLDRGANINAKDGEGKTPLHLAVERVDITMTELLLEKGADINTPDHEGQTPLHLAANHWNYRIVKILLERGSLINSTNNNGQTALHIAVKNGDLLLVNRLLDRGALTDTFDRKRLTPLQYAVMSDYAKLMLKLLSRGADVSVFFYIPEDFEIGPQCGPTLGVHVLKIKWSQPEQSGKGEIVGENPEFKNMCLQELEKIKSREVSDKFSLIQVLDNSRQFDAATCKLFETVLSSPHVDTDFPLYAFVLKVSLLRMKKRHIFTKAAKNFFKVHNHFGKFISNPFHKHGIELILSYLSYIDLQNLIVVTENTLRIKYSSVR